MSVAHVVVHLKPGISDPEGQNTLKALHLLGFAAVKGVHTTKTWDIELPGVAKDKARAEAEAICKRLLTNPVLHDYTITVE